MFRLLISLILLSVFAKAEPAINVYVPMPQDRLGDVAANFWMAYLIQHSLPGVKVNLIIQKKHPKLEEAISRFSNDTFREKVNLVEDGPLPSADMVVSFSVSMEEREKGIPTEIAETAPVTLLLREHDRKSQYNRSSETKGNVVILPTGVQLSGLYVSPVPLSELPIPASSTFCYPRTIKGLNRALEMYSSQRESRRVIKVLLTELSPSGIAEHPNLDIEIITRMPFMQQVDLVRSSELPALVSGDVSLGVAIQCGKPFIFEPPAYKFDYAEELFDFLAAKSQWPERYAARLILSHELKPLDNVPNLSEPEFEKEFQMKLARIRTNHSVITTVVKTWLRMDKKLGRKGFSLFREKCESYLAEFKSRH